MYLQSTYICYLSPENIVIPYRNGCKSGCQRKAGKMLKMSTERGKQNKLILIS